MRQASALRMEKDIEDALREVDWADVGVRLTGYAMWKARNLAWRRGRRELALGARTPDDLAAEAILKVLSGERAWDPRRGALLPYLQGVVDSLLSHAAAAPDVTRTVYAEPPPALTAEVDPAEERVERLRTALQREQQTALLAVVDAIAANCEPRPQALAAHLGTSVADINNRLKRLRRLALRVAAGEQ